MASPQARIVDASKKPLSLRSRRHVPACAQWRATRRRVSLHAISAPPCRQQCTSKPRVRITAPRIGAPKAEREALPELDAVGAIGRSLLRRPVILYRVRDHDAGMAITRRRRASDLPHADDLPGPVAKKFSKTAVLAVIARGTLVPIGARPSE